MVDRVDINRVIAEMRAIKAQTNTFNRPQGIAAQDVAPLRTSTGVDVQQGQNVSSFGELLEQAVNKVNEVQKTSGSLSKAYEQGDPNVDITDVMVASQKAGVSFQAMLQVRNKLIDAYRDVMNMPI